MKAKRIAELRDILASADFATWWGDLKKARATRVEARERYDELLTQAMLMDFRAELAQKNGIDTLYRAGEFEDQAANMVAETQDLENASFKAVAEFEEHRYRTSEVWYRLGAAEKAADDKQEEAAALKARVAAATGAATREIDVELRRVEGELSHAQRTLRLVADEYEREHVRQQRLWGDVEKLWARATEMSLVVAEKRSQGKKVRAQAEQLFAAAEDRKAKAKQLRDEAEEASRVKESAEMKIAELTRQAQDRFGCAAGDEFLYWRVRDNQRAAYAVPLFDDATSYNIEVRALTVYVVDRQRGVAFLSPAVDHLPSTDEGDRRFEEYFLHGRKGRGQGTGAGDQPGSTQQR